MQEKKITLLTAAMAIACASLSAANLANPTVLIPAARIGLGASYDLDGATITNNKVPAVFNRFMGRVSYAPFSFLNIGLDAGASQIDVAADTTSTDTIGLFHGGYGFSGGGHVKFGTPFFFNDLVRGIGIFQGTIFSSKNDAGAVYGGEDATGALGLQFHIPAFGYVTAGSKACLIHGKNKSYLGNEGKYSNVNNVRGWLAIDYFPPMEKFSSKNLLYLSCELSVSPKVKFNARAPVQEIGFSFSVGSITPRLYGQPSEVELNP
jgi:uncharacterized protein (DUF2141 family)